VPSHRSLFWQQCKRPIRLQLKRDATVITLTLLHPIQSTPIQNWRFQSESVIRIGRSSNNHVVLYSAVVSRHHIELRQIGDRWELINLGSNGTYLDGNRVTKIPVQNGTIIRLARSGPRIKIHLHAYVPSTASENQKLNHWVDPDSPEQETTQEEIIQSLSRQVD